MLTQNHIHPGRKQITKTYVVLIKTTQHCPCMCNRASSCSGVQEIELDTPAVITTGKCAQNSLNICIPSNRDGTITLGVLQTLSRSRVPRDVGIIFKITGLLNAMLIL